MGPRGTGRILVVDGEPAILRTITVFLRLKGYECHAAASSEEAFAWLDTNTAHIMLVDFDVYGIEGLGILDKLRRKGSLSQILAMSSHPTVDNIVEAYSLGASDYLVKPFKNLNEVLVAVSHAAERLTRWRTLLAETLAEEGR